MAQVLGKRVERQKSHVKYRGYLKEVSKTLPRIWRRVNYPKQAASHIPRGGQVVETIIFETALGHTALARSGGLLKALSFGHSSERAAWKALLAHRRVAESGAAESAAEPVPESWGAHLRVPDSKSTVVFAQPDLRVVDPGGDALADRICAFAQGDPVDFLDVVIDMEGLTHFQRRVIEGCRRIPHGQTLTYGELARVSGRPGAARAAGSVMARNRMPLVVPCHRVVAASGGLGGFSAPQGVVMKRRLLELEQCAAQLQTG